MHASAPQPPAPPRWGGRFVTLALIWGLSFLLIKLGERSLAPLQVALARTLTGAATLLALSAVSDLRLPRGWRTWGHLTVAGALLNAIPFALIAYGERHVSSVLAGIWNATTPLFTLPVAIAMIDDEHAGPERIAGLVIGFAGVLTVLGIWHGGAGASLPGNLMCMGGALSYGVGFPYARGHLATRPEGPIALAAGQLVCGTGLLAIVTTALTAPPAHLSAEAAAAVLALGALGTGLAYVLNYGLIRDAGATVTSTVTYVIPIFSTLAGVIALGESLSPEQPVGALIIVLGAAIAHDRFAGRTTRARRVVARGRRRVAGALPPDPP